MGYLLLIFIIVLVNDIEELKLIDTLGGRDNTEPVPELVLLQELLGPVTPLVLLPITLFHSSICPS